jgi:SAM-dependent methyltransferase
VTIAPDGSPVELYAVLPPAGEAEVVHEAIPPGATVLELGCGAGRITQGLLALGHPVVAVDESEGMLAHVRGAETVRSPIEELELGRCFPAVLLASNLVNVADDGRRRAFLDACRRHVEPGGRVVLQHYLPDFGRIGAGEASEVGPVRVELPELRRDGGLVEGVVEYSLGERRWRHAFRGRVLDGVELEAALAEAGLRVLARPRHGWTVAGPDTEPPPAVKGW